MKDANHFNYFESLLFYLPHYKLSLDINNLGNIFGGRFPIMNVLANCPRLPAVIKSLKSKNIMFLDQIVTPNGLYLLSWKEIKAKGFNVKGKTPFWYKYLVDNFTINSSLRLSFEIKTPIILSYLGKRPTVPDPSPTPSTKFKSWISCIWAPDKTDIIYGKKFNIY